MAIDDFVSFNCISGTIAIRFTTVSAVSTSFSSLEETFVAMLRGIFTWPSTFIVVSIATADWNVEALDFRSKKMVKAL
ncbi:hypothetical protein MAM1_0049d03266 [Mucor ambiguus]|uniref:Uncharacterized protein n=1 Tax=Mucor ambiguus TaxID=91626 RepID=A0A0C9M400_9FUNG|nr:hypothetical protein MAM1_0049d03266 [Mucor ambiguus]